MYDEINIKSKPMAESSKSKISSLSMEPATNGVIISYCVKKEKAAGKGCYDNCSYEYPKEVFDFDGSDATTKKEGFDKAFERFKELWKEAHNF
jgi:hypothetical protein